MLCNDGTPGWRPATLRGRYLALLAGSMLVMIIAIEAMRMESEARGALAFFEATDDVTRGQQVAYTYVPMVVGVMIGVMWSFTEYDALRLEPYFILSKPKGAPADVLLLNYVFGHFTTTPFRAARNKHWVAVLVSVLSILLQLVLPVVLGKLIYAEMLLVNMRQTVKTWPDFVSLESQGFISHQNSSSQAPYANNGNLAYSPVRSTKYAMAPVQISRTWKEKADLLKVNQTIYWTESSCGYIEPQSLLAYRPGAATDEAPPSLSDVIIPRIDRNQSTIASDSLKNCSLVPEEEIRKKPFHIRDWKLLSSGNSSRICGEFDFIGVIAREETAEAAQPEGQKVSNLGSLQGINPFGCNVYYYVATAEVTLTSNGSIHDIEIDEGSTASISHTAFDLSRFRHSLLRMVVLTDKTNYQKPRPVADDMLEGGVWLAVDQAVGEAFVPLMGRTFDLGRTVYVEAIRVTDRELLKIDSYYSRIAVSILAFGAAVVIGLLYIYPRRWNLLSSNPASISFMCCITSNIIGQESLRRLATWRLDALSTRQLRSILRVCRCSWVENVEGRRLEIIPADDSISRIREGLNERADPPPPFLIIPVFVMGILVACAVLGSIGAIVSISYKDGFIPSLTNIQVRDIRHIWMLVPPIAAALIRGFFISVYQNLTILEPWFALLKGNATAQTSLLLDYGSQSPFAVALRCFKRRYPLFVFVSLTCVLNTFLTIMASALFISEYAPFPTRGIIESVYDRQSFIVGNHTSILAEVDLYQGSIYAGTSMLPWTTQTQFMLPVQTNMTENQWAMSPLVGISANLKCRSLSVWDSLIQDLGSGETYWQYPSSSDPTTLCRINGQSMVLSNKKRRFMIDFIAPTESDLKPPPCASPGILLIAKSNDPDGISSDTVALYCESIPIIQSIDCAFDRSGYIDEVLPSNQSLPMDSPMFANVSVSLANYNRAFSNPLQANTKKDTSTGHHKMLENWFGILTSHVYRQMSSQNFTVVDLDLLIQSANLVYQTVLITDIALHREFHFVRLQTPEVIHDGLVMDNLLAFVPVRPAFIVVFFIVAFDTFVLLYVFLTRRGRFGFPRSPRSLGSMMPWIAKSKMLDDFRGTSTMKESERGELLTNLNKRYALKRTEVRSGEHTYSLDEEPRLSERAVPSQEMDVCEVRMRRCDK
ncbi:hypothetical protein BDV25DRAFT_136219 [Aspergillus avenaceus]|uniref:Uncharacterized protein n=1 Tax=Aspergillus avenaceus TaxID=36643 RepID=A0A5N6U672_ASPAV|nr:hypothetical protein BDV25DRAFT_136219 [Aspergillus avenaceus]